MLLQQRRLLLEQLLANLKRDGIHNRLALAPLQAGHDNLKLRGIQHERHLGNLWLGDGDLDKLLHRCKSIQHAIINIDVDNVCSIFDLGLGNVHRLAVFAGHHELLEFDRSGDVASLANVEEGVAQMIVDILNNKVLKPTEPHLGTAHVWELARLVVRR